jgi:threonine/homoserine/homoserine lactone efflux protein
VRERPYVDAEHRDEPRPTSVLDRSRHDVEDCRPGNEQQRERRDVEQANRESNLRRAFAQGIVVNVLNPKTALFFLAFLPQFVDPNAAHPAVQIAFLGVLFALLGLVTDSVWALVAGTAGGMLRRSRRFVRTQRYVTGTVYVGLGVATAFTGSAED